MTVISAPQQFNTDDLFVDLREIVGLKLFCKVEGMNFAGSVKLKAAVAMVEAAEAQGLLNPWSIIVESSSGNLGVALAMVAANRGYRFVCVTDDRCSPHTRHLIESFGAEVHVVDVPHPETGLLGARLAYLHALRERPDTVWLDQYANPANAGAHHAATAPAIAREIPDLDVLFVGAGTCGTLMGNARWFRQHRPDVRVVAVDVEGSVSFTGGSPVPRRIPGLGMGMTPPALDRRLVDDVVVVPETETLRMCQRLAMRGFLFGGSTGTVVSGATDWLARHGTPGTTAVTLAPDQGERYLQTVYAPAWREQHHGARGTLTGPHTLPGPGPRRV